MFKSFVSKNNFYNKSRKYCKVSVKKNCETDVCDSVKSGNFKSFAHIPGPKSYPGIGTLYMYLPLIGDYKAETLDKNAWLNYRRYGELVREEPAVPLVHVFDPDDIEAVFRQDDRYPARRSHIAMEYYRLSKPKVYNTGGLLSTNGAEWWRLRSNFQKNFTSPQSVRSHIQNSDGIVREFLQWVTETYTPDKDFLIYLNRLNLEVIGMVAFNERFRSFTPSEQDKESRSSKTIEAAFGSNSGVMKLDKGILWRFFKTPLYKELVESQEYLEKVTSEILLKRVHFFEKESDEADKSLISSFTKHPKLDLKDIKGMMVDILMAAVDTSSYATSFALYHLSQNPTSQEKLHKEAVELLPSKDAELTPDILSRATYVRCCIKESLRLNPVAVGVGRLLQKDIVIRRYLIPKGSVIVTQNMLASRLPQYVREPLLFKPERWLRGSPEHENLHPFLSLPFGFGPRSCIARRLAEQNIAITLLRIYREFGTKWNGGELGIKTMLINKPDQSLSFSFTPT